MFMILFTDKRGSKVVVDPERYCYHERAVAETVAEHLETVNNPAWQGTFTVVER